MDFFSKNQIFNTFAVKQVGPVTKLSGNVSKAWYPTYSRERAKKPNQIRFGLSGINQILLGFVCTSLIHFQAVYGRNRVVKIVKFYVTSMKVSNLIEQIVLLPMGLLVKA